jgi:hypothetical protein
MNVTRNSPALEYLRGWVRRFYYTSLGMVAITLIFSSGSIAQEINRNALSEFLDHPDKPIYVRGDYFKAIFAAYNEFSKIFAKRKAESVAPKTDNSKLSSRLSKIENYDIYVEETSGSYSVHFSPTRREPLHEVFGGSATFVVDSASFRIIDRTFLSEGASFSS